MKEKTLRADRIFERIRQKGIALSGGSAAGRSAVFTGGKTAAGLTGGKTTETAEAITGGKTAETAEAITGGKTAETAEAITGGKTAERAETVSGGKTAERAETVSGGKTGRTDCTCAGRGTRTADLPAVMTVEAAIALPLFLFFIFNVIFLLDVVRLQSNLTAALQQAGDQICEYAWYREYAVSGTGGEGEGGGGSVEIPAAAADILSLAFVPSVVNRNLGKEYLDNTCLRGGAGGISYLGSRVLSGNDIVELHADYVTRPFIPVLNGPDLAIRSTYYGHAWTGYEIGSGTGGSDGAGEGGTSGEGSVIVAEYGVVYHTDPDCVYLKPRVRGVDASELGHLRANDGSIYHACEYCRPSAEGTVYITPDGDRYHSSPDCSRLSRTTHEETMEEAEGHLRPCPKCGKQH